MTGSSLPWLARFTRSMPYFSSAWNFSSGLWSVTRELPRTAWRPASSSFSVTAASSRSFFAFEEVFASPKSR